MPLPLARPLLDVLGASWRVGVPVVATAWDGRGGFAGFALGDGSLALAPAAWDNGPTLRPREGGGVELVPGAVAPPVARVPVHQGACLSVAADPDGGFLSSGADGQVARVQSDGEIRVIAQSDGPVAMIAAGPGAWRACASGRTVHRVGMSASSIDVETAVTSLALDPCGARLAISHEGGVTLWAGGNGQRLLAGLGAPSGLTWSADGAWLACAAGDALHAWRLLNPAAVTVAVSGPAGSLTTAGSAFAAGVGGRVILWRPASPDTVLQLCGVPNQATITHVGCHPRKDVIAAGYANGPVVLCQPNSAALMFLRVSGEGAVSALGFSPAGDYLAIGTEGGEIAVLALPDVLFRESPRSK
ncbi:MAG: WD40 repeat domain-containing protein [Rhodopila sp.]